MMEMRMKPQNFFFVFLHRVVAEMQSAESEYNLNHAYFPTIYAETSNTYFIIYLL